MTGLRAATFGLGIGFALLIAMPVARALPPPHAPLTKPSGTPVPLPTGNIYPVGTPLLFLVDEPVNSGKTQPGTSVPIHLRDALVVNGVTLAPAGTMGAMTIVAAQHARAPDTDGAVEIRIEPLILPSGKVLPLRAIHEYLTRELSAGQVTTRGVMDQTEDVFMPELQIYQVFRKGHELTIPRDSVIRVQTAAIIDATNPNAVAITTPPPMPLSGDIPHSDYTPIALATPFAIHPNARATVKPRVTPTPSPAPVSSDNAASASPSDSSSPAAPGSPAASGSPAVSAAPASPVAAAMPPASPTPLPVASLSPGR